MITQKDWKRLKEFITTPQQYRVVGCWGWETCEATPSPEEILEFIKNEIGIKEHIK